jgi:hypothetical protein
VLAALITSIVGALASSIAAAYFKYHSDRLDEQLKLQVPKLQSDLTNAQAVIASRDEELARKDSVIASQEAALQDARHRLVDQLGPEGARLWLKDLLEKP